MRVRGSENRDDRGMSLVEVLCAVAIFSLVAAVIAGVVTVSARIYRNGVSQTSLQQEAQYLSNQIGNLVKDANKVGTGTIDTVSGYIICTTDSEGYLLEYNSAGRQIQYYTYITNGDGTKVLSSPALLAEHVKTFEMDTADFEDTRAVKLTLEMERDEKSYKMEYTMTARNEVVQNIEFSEIPDADIECEQIICLVPGETWNLPVTVSGKTGGIDIACDSGVTVPRTHYAENESFTNLELTLDKGVTDQVKTVILKTTNTVSEDSTVPLKSVIVTILVRRVNSIQVNHATDLTGTLHNTYEEAGTVFTFYADADVYNASRKVGKSWDDEWKQPAAVEWSAELKVNGTSVSVNDYFEKVGEEANAATPMIKYRLKKDMPSGLEFTVKAVSLHRKGENKNHAAYYDTAGQDKDIYGTDTVEPRDTKISGTGYMVLEPTQSGSVKPVISMLGAATDNLKCELVGATDSATTVTYVDGQVTVKLGEDETGSTQYYVNEKGNSVNGSGIIKAVIYSGDKVYDDLEDKADTAKVYIFVRRVTGLDLNYKIMSGTNYPHTEPFKEDTTYQFRTRIDGTNLETLWFETGYKENASTTDKIKIADYCKRFGIEFKWQVKQKGKEPTMIGTTYWMSADHNSEKLPKNQKGKKADFASGSFESDNLRVLLQGFNSNGPCLNVKLLTDYPAGTEFEVTATVLHTKGSYSFNGGSAIKTNKTGNCYSEDISRTVSLNNVIEFTQGYVVADPTQGQDTEKGDTVHMMRIPIQVETRIGKLLPELTGNKMAGTKVLTGLTESASNGGTGYIYLAIDKDEQESNNLILTVKATAVKDNAGNYPLATIEIPIHIRRVTDVKVMKRSGNNEAGSTMTFEATANGVNAANYFVPHRNEDGTELYPWDKKDTEDTKFVGYMTPYAWQWSISFDEGATWHDFIEDEKNQLVIDPNDTEMNRYISSVTGSGIKLEKESSTSVNSLVVQRQKSIKLTYKEKLPNNSKIKATSLHAAGENRGGKPYAVVEGIYTIKDIDLIDSNIQRATETRLIDFEFNCHEHTELNQGNMIQRQFFRYREIGTEWKNSYHIMQDHSERTSVLNQKESLLLDPNKEYEIEVICVVYDPTAKKVYWPQDESLFENGKGWSEAGFTKGWSGDDVTDQSQYQRNYYVGASTITFGENTQWGVADGSETFGSYGKDNPIPLKGGEYGHNSDRIDIDLLTRYYNVQKMLTHYRGEIQQLTNGTWVTIADGSNYNSMEPIYHFALNMAQSSGNKPVNYLSTYTIYNIHAQNEVQGTYRILPYLYETDFYEQSGELLNPVYTLKPKTFRLYESEDDDCIVYFKLN